MFDEDQKTDGLENAAATSKFHKAWESVCAVSWRYLFNPWAANTKLRSANEQLEVKIVELKDTMEELKKEATTDPLTGACNRRELAKRGLGILKMIDRHPHDRPSVRKEGPNMVALYIDLDYLKLYNDTAGHQGGDKVLQTLSTAMQRVTRSENDVVARVGGDEFVILLQLHRDEGVFSKENFRKRIKQQAGFIIDADDNWPRHENGNLYPFEFSMGAETISAERIQEAVLNFVQEHKCDSDKAHASVLEAVIEKAENYMYLEKAMHHAETKSNNDNESQCSPQIPLDLDDPFEQNLG